MPQDGVYWSSKIEHLGGIWIWSVIIYTEEGPISREGWSWTQKRAKKKKNKFLRSMGETP